MSTTTARSPARDRLLRTEPRRHVVIARIVAGVPLLGIGLSHAFVPEAPMLPLVEAAGFPLPGLVSIVGVATQIVAGALLLVGLLARLAGLAAIPIMLGAIYTHLVIDVWPNTGAQEPPLLLPIAVLLASAYVVVRGGGRWSLDRRL